MNEQQVRPDPERDPIAWREYWLGQIAAAQDLPEYEIDGACYSRIPLGQESSESKLMTDPCHDCGITVGQLHVPGCDVEMCPVCHGQAISCDCEYYPGDSEQLKRAAQSLHRDPTPEHARWLGFHM